MDYLHHLQEYIENFANEDMYIGFCDGSFGTSPSKPESPWYMKAYNLGLIEYQKQLDDEFKQYLIEIDELNPEDIVSKK